MYRLTETFDLSPVNVSDKFVLECENGVSFIPKRWIWLFCIALIVTVNYLYSVVFLSRFDCKFFFLQCFDAVGWASGRASGL